MIFLAHCLTFCHSSSSVRFLEHLSVQSWSAIRDVVHVFDGQAALEVDFQHQFELIVKKKGLYTKTLCSEIRD